MDGVGDIGDDVALADLDDKNVVADFQCYTLSGDCGVGTAHGAHAVQDTDMSWSSPFPCFIYAMREGSRNVATSP